LLAALAEGPLHGQQGDDFVFPVGGRLGGGGPRGRAGEEADADEK
jgi:hypothetical protein